MNDIRLKKISLLQEFNASIAPQVSAPWLQRPMRCERGVHAASLSASTCPACMPCSG